MSQKNNTVFGILSLLGVAFGAYIGAASGLGIFEANGNFLMLQPDFYRFGDVFNALINGTKYVIPGTLIGAVIAGIIVGQMYIYRLKRFHRRGKEHGSARWAYPREAKKLADKKKKFKTVTAKTWIDKNGNPVKFQIDNNILITDDVSLSLNTRQHMKNTHVLTVGGSGSGKTRFFGKPNIMQLNTSYVITDPKGELLQSTGQLLIEAGYDVRVFNLINMGNSNNYNPFEYVYDDNGNISEDGVLKMVDAFMRNTKGEDEGSSNDPFWDNAAKALITAIVFLLLEEGTPDEKNFAGVLNKIKLVQINMRNPAAKSPLDLEFDVVSEKNPASMAIKFYTDFKKAAPETAMSIVINCTVKLQAFNIPKVADLTHKDDLSLNTVGDKKTALFIIIPASDKTYNFLAAMMYTQMFDALYNRANFKFGGRLPVHVRCILDEFANIGHIPGFDVLIATMRSMEISVNIIIQNIAQLKAMYEKTHEVISGNCDTYLFLGGKETSTLEEVSKLLGKETIDISGYNRTRGKQSSTSENNSIAGRELMTIDELTVLNVNYCIAMIRGIRPFYGRKYNITKHRHYKFLEDYNAEYSYNYRTINTAKRPKPLTDKEKADLFFVKAKISVKNTAETEPKLPNPMILKIPVTDNTELIKEIKDGRKKLTYDPDEIYSEPVIDDGEIIDYENNFIDNTQPKNSEQENDTNFADNAEFDDDDVENILIDGVLENYDFAYEEGENEDLSEITDENNNGNEKEKKFMPPVFESDTELPRDVKAVVQTEVAGNGIYYDLLEDY